MTARPEPAWWAECRYLYQNGWTKPVALAHRLGRSEGAVRYVLALECRQKMIARRKQWEIINRQRRREYSREYMRRWRALGCQMGVSR